MKKLLIVFVTMAPLWCMEPEARTDKAVVPFNERVATQRLLALADLVESSPRERPFGSLDPSDLALGSAADEPAQSPEGDEEVAATALAQTLMALAQTKERFIAIDHECGLEEFSTQLAQAMSDDHDLAELLTPADEFVPDRMESALAYLQKPVVLVPAAVGAASVPQVTRTIRSQKRSPITLLSSLVGSKLFYGVCAVSLISFYEAKNGYKNLKLWWRSRKIDRLTAALDKIEIVKKYQEALTTRISTLEEAQQQEILELNQAQANLKAYVDQLATAIQTVQLTGEHVAAATEEAFVGIKHEIGEETVTLAALKETNQAIQAKLAGSLGIIARMRETLERLAAASKKKK